jgi:class 3 adenylate cyclase
MGTMQEFGQGATARKIDPSMQRQVIELASRLQERDRDHVTEWELEQLAEEAGLSREYVRQALRQIDKPEVVKTPKKSKPREEPVQVGNPTWFVITASLVCFGWGALADIVNRPYDTSRPFILFALPMVALIGYAAGRRPLAGFFACFFSGMTMLNARWEVKEAVFLLCCGTLLGLAGCWVRERTNPVAPEHEEMEQPVVSDDRLDRLERLRSLRSELESERIRRAFVSIDVVGSFRLKQELGELEAERLFGRYQRWLSEIVSNHGGEIQSAAGDGAMAMFPNGLSALRSSRSLVRALAQFNAENDGRLHIRIGISEGAVPWRAGQPIGSIQSPVLDRAALRQKSAPTDGVAIGEELVTEAAVEFGSLEAVSSNTADRVFVCRPTPV